MYYDEDARFFAEMEESLLDDDSPLWQRESEPVAVRESPSVSDLLVQELSSARKFIPEYSRDIQQDYSLPPIEMYSLEGYINTAHKRFADRAAGWEMCLKCSLEGDYKGTRVMPSIVKLAATPLPSAPITILTVGEA